MCPNKDRRRNMCPNKDGHSLLSSWSITAEQTMTRIPTKIKRSDRNTSLYSRNYQKFLQFHISVPANPITAHVQHQSAADIELDRIYRNRTTRLRQKNRRTNANVRRLVPHFTEMNDDRKNEGRAAHSSSFLPQRIEPPPEDCLARWNNVHI